MQKVEEMRVNPTKLRPLVIGDKLFRSSYDHELSPEDVEQARKELNETDDVRSRSLQKLKEKLSKDGIKYRTDDDYLLRFLRCRKFNVEEAHEKMRYFYKKRKSNPEVFCAVPPNIEELLNLNMFIYLPYRDEEGSIIILDRFGRWDIQKQTIYGLLQFFQSIADVLTMNPSCQINKIIIIVDCKDTYARQYLTAGNPSVVLFWLSVWQSLYVWRIKYIILLNLNQFAYTLLNSIRFFLKKKISDRIVIIGSDMSKLHKYINPALLPKEYGGSLEESECSINEHILNNLPYIRYEQSFCDV